MTIRNPRLPGNPVPRTVKYRDTDDQVIEVDRADVQRRLLAALVAQPLMKWQLRALLHIPEQVIFKELLVLRQRGQVKVVGRRLIDRQWALASWRPPAAPARTTPIGVDARTVVHPAPKKPEPGKSWWLGLPPEQFYAYVKKRPDDQARVAQAVVALPSSRTASQPQVTR